MGNDRGRHFQSAHIAMAVDGILYYEAVSVNYLFNSKRFYFEARSVFET
jgi:hypothetical protein